MAASTAPLMTLNSKMGKEFVITYIMMTIKSVKISFGQTPKSHFFPDGMSKLGAVGKMHFGLSNFAQERITEFKNIDGNTCTSQEYFISEGLLESHCFVYLMWATTEEDKEKASKLPIETRNF